MALEERIARLEVALGDERRRRRRDRGIVGLVACASMLIAAGGHMKTLRAERVEIGPSDIPRIVLGEGQAGPLIELRDSDGFVATLTSRGLTMAPPPPIVPPTLDEPGLAKVVVAEDLGTTARVYVEDYASAIEVACPGLGYRERTRVVGGSALVSVPDDPKCTAHVKGGKIIGRFAIKRSSVYRCSVELRPACQVVVDMGEP